MLTPFKWHKDAFKLAKKIKIELFSTPFSIKAVDFLKLLIKRFIKYRHLKLTIIS